MVYGHKHRRWAHGSRLCEDVEGRYITASFFGELHADRPV